MEMDQCANGNMSCLLVGVVHQFRGAWNGEGFTQLSAFFLELTEVVVIGLVGAGGEECSGEGRGGEGCSGVQWGGGEGCSGVQWGGEGGREGMEQLAT